jgi:hypothetical protein
MEVDQVLIKGNTMLWAYGLQNAVECFMEREQEERQNEIAPVAPAVR